MDARKGTLTMDGLSRSSMDRLALPISIAAFVMAGVGTLFRPGFALTHANAVVTPPPAIVAQASAPAAPAIAVSAATVASANPAPVAIPAPQYSLSQAELEKLYARGQVLIGAGDFAAARLLLIRASEAGHPGATFALASTYDPNVLAKGRVKGLVGEPEQAKQLYARALAAGMNDARQRIAALGG
jgi:TPR repeat protein